MTPPPTARRSASAFLYFDAPHAWAGAPPHRQALPGTHAPAYVHAGRRGARRLWPSPSRSLLGILLLLGLALGAAAWNARPKLAPALPAPAGGIDLLATGDSPKVNSTSAERPPEPPAEPFATPIPKVEPPVRTPEIEPQPPALPALPAPPALPEAAALPAPLPVAESALLPPAPPLPPVVPPAVLEPGSLAQSCFREMLPGETPMKRTWNVLKVTSLLAAAVVLATLPAPAGPTEVGDNDIKQLKDSIDVLNKSLTKLIENTNNGFAGVRVDLDKVRDEIKALNKDVQTLTKDNYETKLQLQAALGNVKDLEKQILALKAEVDKLQTNKEKISLYPKPDQGFDEIKARLTQIETSLNRLTEGRTSFAPPPAALGRIQLVNQYPQRILFVINGKNYGVDPFTTVNLDNQPAGTFKYEVFADGYGMLRSSTPLLEAGKTYTITVR